MSKNQKTTENTPKKPIYKKWWFWVIIVIVIIGVGGSSASNNSTDNTSRPSTSKTQEERDAEKAAEEERKAKEQAEQEQKIANAATVNYTDLFRNSGDYSGQYLKFVGEVVQTDSSNSYCRIATTKSQYSESYYEDVVYLAPCTTDGTKILEDDLIEFVGVGDGTFSYKTVLGSQMEIPKLKAAKITLIKHIDD